LNPLSQKKGRLLFQNILLAFDGSHYSAKARAYARSRQPETGIALTKCPILPIL